MSDLLTLLILVGGLVVYLGVPALAPQLAILVFPGSRTEAQAAMAAAARCRNVPIVARATVGAMAQEMPSAGLWVLSTLPRWSWSAFWPLWLPGSVRGAVRGAVIANNYCEGRLDG